jgi:hypothetical protein
MNTKTCYVIKTESKEYYRHGIGTIAISPSILKATLYDYEDEAEDVASRINIMMDDHRVKDLKIGTYVEVVPVKVTVEEI